uniref:uncharacterized protein LOC122587194 n=1 Tax=Erigeron canadensis TaxID=72917 RepID=UPI001CB8A557|nr:uncharacterized protein LOC122587194 [Erigeron canadensis]XP_043615231.1 uncharacterized protein LOC122587194 [Erigeron canadensis]
MDKWMVAVAAGAGYIAQHFKKNRQDGEQVTSKSSVEDVELESPKQPSDKKWPFRRLSRRDSLKKDDSEVRSEVCVSEFDVEKGMVSGSYEGSSVFSASSLFPGFIGSGGILGDAERGRVSEGKGELVNKPLTPRSRMFLRSRRKIGVAFRPLSSLESCLRAQLHTEHVEMNPSMQTVRPFFVTDGSNVISRASGDSFVVQSNVVEKNIKTYSEENKTGLTDATLLVCLGMSFGILYSFMSNKLEVERLNRVLKQKDNLVQDLEEELEMKDSLIMKELTTEDHKSQRMGRGSLYDGSPTLVSDEHNNQESVVIKAKDDSFSKIEAELQAELAMLELNMTSSTLERKISDLVEHDPDFEAGVAEVELRADMLDNQSNADEDDRGSSTTTHSANYAVSPRELSLRLHEVLQSQLEERIRELEAEIESQQVQNYKSWNDVLSSDAGDEIHVDGPVVLNLSGEALDAYKEACNEFAKLDESEEDVDGTPMYQFEDDGSRNGAGTSEDGKDFDDDEMEKLLIKHIVEKARQGSPVVLNAQRALFSE